MRYLICASTTTEHMAQTNLHTTVTYANFALDVTHLVTCTELTNNVRGIGKNFVKISAENLMNIPSGQHQKMVMAKEIHMSYDNKVYTFIYIT